MFESLQVMPSESLLHEAPLHERRPGSEFKSVNQRDRRDHWKRELHHVNSCCTSVDKPWWWAIKTPERFWESNGEHLWASQNPALELWLLLQSTVITLEIHHTQSPTSARILDASASAFAWSLQWGRETCHFFVHLSWFDWDYKVKKSRCKKGSLARFYHGLNPLLPASPVPSAAVLAHHLKFAITVTVTI